jgi:gamma-tubulin complex component 3
VLPRCSSMSSDNPRTSVGALLRALAVEFVGEAGAENATRSAARLLDSALGTAPSLQSETALNRSVITRLMRDGRHLDATRFAQLAAALKFEPAVQEKTAWSITYLLAGLKDSVTAVDALPPESSIRAKTASAEALQTPSIAARTSKAVVGFSRQTRTRVAQSVFDPPPAVSSRSGALPAPVPSKSPLSPTAAVSALPVGGNNSDPETDEDGNDYYDAQGRPTAAATAARARACRAAPEDPSGARSFGITGTKTHVSALQTAQKQLERPRGVAVLDDQTGPVTTRAAEIVLVRDVMLIVQGEDGRYLRFPPHGTRIDDDADYGDDDSAGDEDDRDGRKKKLRELERKRRRDKECIEILPLPGSAKENGLSLSSIHIVRYIAELGFLFKIVRRRLHSVDENPGLVSTNFCSAVDREMEAYYRSLASFHTGPDVPDEYLPSLRTVFVWAEEEKPRLRWLARLCEETISLVGGQTLAHLRSYRKSYVADDVRSMLSRLIARTAAPLDLMLIRWVTEGVIVDPHGEFYIMQDPKVAAAAANSSTAAFGSGGQGIDRSLITGGPNAASAASHRIWWGLFKKRVSMIPGFQSAAVVENTLVAGKSIAFLRRCCDDSTWVDQVHAPAMSAYLSEQQANSDGSNGNLQNQQFSGRGFPIGTGLLDQDPRMGTDHVAELVRRAVRSASMRLKTLFFDKFDLSHHFAAIKNYLLLSQGDFTQALMESLAPMLDGDGRILRNNITGLLDTALRSSSSFNPETDQDIAERLDVQIVTLASSDSANVGWDVFSLTYRVEDAPLNTVFSRNVMDAYLIIFRFLWHLKRMDYVLGSGYLELRELDTAWRKRRRWNKNEIARLRGGEDEGDDDDDVDNDVSDLINRAHFLRMKMAHLLQNIQYYCTFEVLEGNWKVLSDEMSRAEDIDTLIQAHARYLGTIKDRTLLSERSKTVAVKLDAVLATIVNFWKVQRAICEWGMELGIGGFVDDETVSSLEQELEAVEDTFSGAFDIFLEELGVHALNNGSCMFLVFRLDYNMYYANRQIAAASSADARTSDAKAAAHAAHAEEEVEGQAQEGDKKEANARTEAQLMAMTTADAETHARRDKRAEQQFDEVYQTDVASESRESVSGNGVDGVDENDEADAGEGGNSGDRDGFEEDDKDAWGEEADNAEDDADDAENSNDARDKDLHDTALQDELGDKNW